jgi:hypothetical protein
VDTVRAWRKRFVTERLAALADRPRPGGRPRLSPQDKLRIIAAATAEPLGADTVWTHRLLADHLHLTGLAVSTSQIGRILSAADLKPHLVRGWLTRPADPEFFTRAVDVCNLYRTCPWSWGQPHDVRPVHLFARLPEGCLYLGVGISARGRIDDGLLFSADLTIVPPLPGEVLDKVRPPSEPGELPDVGWMAKIADDPGAALTDFVQAWFPETYRDLGDLTVGPWDVPDPLAGFYRLARRRPKLLGVQNFIEAPERWYEGPDGLIVFGHENQGAFKWLFDPRRAEPEVWIDQDMHDLRREREALGGFLIQFAMHEAMMAAPYRAGLRDVTGERVRQLAEGWSPLPWSAWRWPTDSTYFHAAPGLIATVREQSGGGFEIWAGGVHRSVLDRLVAADVPASR